MMPASKLAALAALLAAPAAWAQLELHAVIDGAEIPLGPTYNLGAVATGESRFLNLRVRNTGSAAAQITRFQVNGVGFSLLRAGLPHTLSAGTSIDARLTFAPEEPAMYSANLQMNSTSVLVLATALPTPLLTVFPACTGSLPRKVDFGSVEAGKLRLCNFNLQNPTNEPMTIGTFTVSGAGFSGPVGRAAPFTLAAGQTTSFEVHFVAPRAGTYTGALTIQSLTYTLTAVGVNPPLPKPLLDLEAAPLESAQQRRLSMRLPEPAPFDANGNVQLAFLPDSSLGGDDPAIVFVATGARSVPFAVRQGSTEVLLGGQPFAVLQTGTSAGQLRFSVSGVASGFTADPTTLFRIAPRSVALDSAAALRGLGRLDVRIVGYDNTYTTGAMAFTFYDTAGRVIGGGPVQADFTGVFRAFYTSSQAGSAFQVTVTFPVSGDEGAVAAVEAEVTNAAGTTRTGRLPFP